MAKINLLPWREELRKQQNIEFGIMAGIAVVVALLAWGGVFFYYTQKIDFQNARNKYLDSQIALLDSKIKEIQALEQEKQRLLDRMRAIEQLQSNRPLIVRLFDELVKALPEGVSLTKITQQGENITINGVAESNARVSSFMENIKASAWLRAPQLEIIQAQAGGDQVQRVSNFTLRARQHIPKAEAQEGGA
jgi:type IV pilus assembly protein PilN